MYSITIISFFIFLVFTITGSFFDLRGSIKVSPIVLFVTISCIFLFLGNLFYSRDKKNNKRLKNSLIIYTILYLLVVFFFTNMSRGNDIFDFYNIQYNLIPFKYIISKIQIAIETGIYDDLVMILGNYLVLIPLAYLLPRTIKKTKKFSWFCIFILLCTILIESGQFVFGGGVFDIDDIILNSLGPIMFYRLFNKSKTSKLLDNIILQEHNKVSKKDKMVSIIYILLICLLFILCIYLYWYHTPGYEVIIDIQNDICENDKIKAYEDDSYIYYYNCSNYDDLYIIFTRKYLFFNLENKYKIKDLLEGKVKTRLFETSMLKNDEYFTVESILPEFKFTYYGDVNIEVTAEDNTIINIVDQVLESSIESTTFLGYLQSKKSGITDLNISITDNMTDEIIEKIIYEVEVDKNLIINYNVKETNRIILKLDHKTNATTENKPKSKKVSLNIKGINEQSERFYNEEYKELNHLIKYAKDKLNTDINYKWKYYIHYYDEEEQNGFVNFTYYISSDIMTNKYLLFAIEDGKINKVYYNNVNTKIDEEKVKEKAYNYFNNTIQIRPTIKKHQKIEEEIKYFLYDYKTKNIKYIYSVTINSDYDFIKGTEYLVE